MTKRKYSTILRSWSTTNACDDNNNVHEMEASEITYVPKVAAEAVSGSDDTLPKNKVIIVDGMVLVNAIPKTDHIKTCNYFAQVFLDQLSNMAGNYDEVRLVVDRYLDTSLKEQMRRKRTKGKSTYCHVKALL